MKIAHLVLSLVLIGNLAMAAAPEIGLSEAELLQQQAKPLGKIAVGGKTVYRWLEMQVTVREGKVSEVQLRDVAKEEADAARRAEIVEQKNLAEAQRIRNEAREKQIRAQQAAANGQAAGGGGGSQALSRNELNLRVAKLQKEKSEASDGLKKAETSGNKAQTDYYRSVMEKKDKEIAGLLATVK